MAGSWTRAPELRQSFFVYILLARGHRRISSRPFSPPEKQPTKRVERNTIVSAGKDFSCTLNRISPLLKKPVSMIRPRLNPGLQPNNQVTYICAEQVVGLKVIYVTVILESRNY